ncbi:hypothetical protein D3C77_656850 [compost metagenome]
MDVSKIFVPQRKLLKATKYLIKLQLSLYQAQAVLSCRLRRKVWIKSLQKLVLNGVKRAAVCVLL